MAIDKIAHNDLARVVQAIVPKLMMALRSEAAHAAKLKSKNTQLIGCVVDHNTKVG